MKIIRKFNWEYVPVPDDPYTTVERLIFYEIFQANVYSVLFEEINNRNVLDVGGHFGFFSILASFFNAKQILGIEANPINFIKYLENTKEIKNAKAIHAACTNRTGDIVSISNDGMGSRINTGDMLVTTISFADALNSFSDKKDVVVKMDVEGAEHLILKNIDPNLFKDRVSILTLEIHDEIISGIGNSTESLKNYICNLGYDITWQGWYTHSKDTCIVKFARK